MSVKRILITGSGGFVGTNLTRSLIKQYHISGIDLHQSGLSKLNEFYKWNELEHLQGYDTIIHLAGIAHNIHNASEPQTYYDVNIDLTKKIFDFFIRSESRMFIFFSSVKAVADSLDNKILTEGFIPNPKTPYGKSKLAAERHILMQRIAANKKVIILRPCMIHGPGNKGNLNILYKYVKRGFPYPLGCFKNLRSFLSVQNLVYIVTGLIENPVSSGTYNVADDDSVSTNEIIELIAGTLHKKPWVWNCPLSLVNFIAKSGDLFNMPFNSDRLNKLTGTYIVSNSKLKNALGIDKLPVSSRDGLIRTFESFSK